MQAVQADHDDPYVRSIPAISPRPAGTEDEYTFMTRLALAWAEKRYQYLYSPERLRLYNLMRDEITNEESLKYWRVYRHVEARALMLSWDVEDSYYIDDTPYTELVAHLKRFAVEQQQVIEDTDSEQDSGGEE